MLNEALEIFASRFTPPGRDSCGVGSLCLPSLTGSADAFLAAVLAERNRVVLAVTPGMPDADCLVDDLRILTARTPTRILELPPKIPDDRNALGVRIRTAAAIRAWSLNPYPCVIVASYPAVATPISIGQQPLFLGTDSQKDCRFSSLCENLAKYGYERMPQVEKEGDYSVRGGLVDFWSPGEEFPVRAEFFGDELEGLRTFNPASQTSVERIDSCEVVPVSEGAENREGETGSVLELLPRGSVVLALEHNSYPPLASSATSFSLLYTGDPAPAGVPTCGFQTTPLPGFAELGADEAHHPELFDAARQRLEQHLEASEKRGTKVVRMDDLSGGFEIPGLIVVTKADRVFTKRKSHRAFGARHPVQGERLSDFEDLEPGEYVVHVDYGVGRYIGSSEIVVDGRRSEVFTIEYADGGKLHVPAAHAHLLSRYVGVRGEAVRMHRLDGRRWEKDKKDAQKAVSDLAAALLETQARRETVPGFAYDVACEGLDAFEAAFPYEETPDQTAAIAAVKEDLARTRPMDRLICGDAGYGKTEVAMRAAFIAAMNGKQVAVLAPTTVLAEQHFETFTSRFDGTPIRIESCSRFQSAGTHAGTFRRLATGVCDIVIGTHAILSKKICFHDLGLVIVDEEQRFGVRQKEYLKRLRATADILTLSATPIPRTLYLSMTGARDLSLLRSPPRERVAVETHIVRDSDETVRSAIETELARGGQVFFLHNRVSDIGRIEKRLCALFPSRPSPDSLSFQPRIVVAHGQMDSRTLAEKMRAFESGAYDILLSTTIVESGIDIPRANTILVDRADCFGMADLYQLRGRVGRSSRQGYAYFLLPPSGLVDAEARERLDALKRHGGLGSGFNLAVRDLELRGAGNLLGAQQSGHIAAVGFGLYCQLLRRTIALLKGETPKEIVDVKLNLDFIGLSPSDGTSVFSAALPYDYVEEDAQRMNFMKRFAEASEVGEVKALAAELQDRFGRLPPAAARLVKLAELRVRCARCGYGNLDVLGSRATFARAGSRDVALVVTLRGKTPDRKIAELIRSVSKKA